MSIVDSTADGSISERLHRITDTLQRYVDEGKIAGAVTVIARRNQIAYFECAVMMDIGAHKAMQRKTIFRIASMTKPITATAVLAEQPHPFRNPPLSRHNPFGLFGLTS